MYHEHWGLRESPFRGGLDPRAFYEGPQYEEALARLRFLVDERRRLGLLAGPSGSGKSLLLETFAEQLRSAGMVAARVSLLGVEPAEFLWALAAAFRLNLDPAASTPMLWRALEDRLAEYRYQRLAAVVLLDDADRAEASTMGQVARLVRRDSSPEARETFVLATRPEHVERLGADLLDLCELRIELRPWDAAETGRYLDRSLARVGASSPVFDRPAVERLHELCGGIPRRVGQLADLALLAAAGQNLDRVDAELIESVQRELAAATDEAERPRGGAGRETPVAARGRRATRPRSAPCAS